jgi:hypothetical protein
MPPTNIELRYSSPRGLRELWAGFLLGPTAWFVHLSLSYFLAQTRCEDPSSLSFLLTTVIFGLVALTGTWFSWKNFDRTGREWPRGEDDGVLIRSRFLAIAGLLLSALSLLAIAGQTVPMLVLPPCS